MRATTIAALAALCTLGAACADDFAPKSAVLGVRVLGVKVDTPYARPGARPKLSMLLVDGGPGRTVREPKVVWIQGCTNPPGDIFHQCYPDLTRRLGAAFGDRPAPIGAEVPGLVTLGTTTRAVVPDDALTTRPDAEGRLPQGRVFVFFVACGGDVVYDPAPPRSSGLPLRCVDPASGADLPADELVFGYTPIFVFAELTNANPVVEGVTFRGAPATTATCDTGCPEGHACSGHRCLPIVPRCDAATEDDCPKHHFAPVVARSSVELDVITSALDRRETGESLWVEYAARGGRFESGTRVLHDPSRGWIDDHAGRFTAFGAPPGEATLYAIVRDNRGGQSFATLDVLVQ